MYAALIIDADADAQFAIQNAFSDDPIEFRFASSAQDGIEQAASSSTDLILIRIELPSSSGFSVFSKLRRNPATKKVPVVLYASDVADDVFTRHASLRTHAEGYLRLPIQQSELHALIRPILSLEEPEASTPAHKLDVEIRDSSQPEPPQSPWGEQFDGEELDSALNPLSAIADEEQPDPPLEVALTHDEPIAEPEPEPGIAANENPDAEPEASVVPESAPHEKTEVAAEPVSEENDHPEDSEIDIELSGEDMIDQEAFDLTDDGDPLDFAPLDDVPLDSPPPPTPLDAPASPAMAPSASLAEQTPPAQPQDVEVPSAAPRMSPSSPSAARAAVNLQQPAPSTPPPTPAANLGAVEPTPLRSEPPSRAANRDFAERRELLTLKSQLLNKDRELLTLREQLERLERDALEQRTHRRGHQSQVAELQASQLQAEESILAAQEQIETLRQDLAQQREETQATKDQLAESRSLQIETEQARVRLATELEDLRERVQQETQQALEQANEARDAANAKIQELELQTASHAEELSKLQNQVQERDTTLHSREEQIRNAHASLSELLARLDLS